MSINIDEFITLSGSGEGLVRDRGSKFIAHAYPIIDETDVAPLIDALWKEHPKSRHVCYAWRLGIDKNKYRVNDDGEPAGTGGRPILGKIDSAGLTNTLVCVVRYFGGTLLGTSGLIEAYGGAAQEAIALAPRHTRCLTKQFQIEFDYALQPIIMQSLHRTGWWVLSEDYTATGGLISLAVRLSEAQTKLLHFKSAILQQPIEQAEVSDWPLVLTELEDGDYRLN
jgi:uncharacterized YigZ family protein